MNDGYMQSNNTYTIVNAEIKIKTDIENLYDLTYTLVDLQAIYGSLYHLMLGNDISSTSITSTRRFNEQYKNALSLKSFNNGCIILTVVTSVASALIAEFLKRTIWGASNTPKIEIKYENCVIINNNDSRKDNIIIKNYNINNSLNENLDANEFVKDFFDNLHIIEGEHEENINKFLKELQKRGYIKLEESYDNMGRKVIANNIRRFEARV